MQDFAHHALSLVCLEEILSVRRTVKNDQHFWFRGFIVLLLNPGETRSIPAGIVTCHDEEAR